MRRFCVLVVSLLIGTAPTHAQDTLSTPSEPPEWGEISKEVLRAEDHPSDSNASAVILSDYGKAYFQNEEFELRRRTRIKILDEGGYESGTVTIPFYAEGGRQKVDQVEGVTYTLEEGKIRKHRLDDDNTFKLKSDDAVVEDLDGKYKQVRFTLPNLEPGAVIEYRYELDSKSWAHIPGWSFQHDKPTLYSKYTLRPPGFVEFVTLTTGRHNLNSVYTDRKSIETERHWVAKNVPALREGPYMTTLEDYRSRVEVQVRAVRNPTTGQVKERFMSSWSDLAETLVEAETFGKNLEGETSIETQAETLTEGRSSDSAKVHAIYDYVQSSVTWNGKTRAARDRTFDEILTSKTGTSAEVNLLLVSLLRNAGLEAHPVLLSTRDHGQVFPKYPILDQFNSVVAAVQLPGREKRVLLDATDPLCPPSMLPKRDLNQQGWLVREKNPTWIEIPSSAANRQVYVQGTLQPDGTLKGKLSVQDRGYEAFQTRQILQDKDPSTIIKTRILKNHPSVSLSEVSVKNQDSLRAPLKLTATLKSPGYAQATGSMLHVNPRIAVPVEKNPFTRKKRTFPVDFAYPRKTTYILSLQLPDGYEVKEGPQSRKVKLPENDGIFTRRVRANRGRVSIRSAKHISTPRVPPKRYKSLRTFYTKMVSAQSEQFVLEATSAGAGSSSPGDEE